MVDYAQVVLQLVPDYRPSSPGPRPVEGILAGHEMSQRVETLEAGGRRTLLFETPFYSRAGFSTSAKAFRVENLVPGLCESVTVRYVVLIVP